MPRYRTISCQHCGFMQLKRDKTCDGCGRLTAREGRKLAGGFVYLCALLVIGLVFYAKIHSVLTQATG
jgi:hypothetical protein